VAFGADEPNSIEPAKGLKEGVWQMRGEVCVSGEEEDEWRKGRGMFFVFCFVLYTL